MNTYISVIIPVYNAEAWLAECLDSVCGQSLRELEIVCVNDGSPDGSRQILREYAARDARIIVIDKENEGVGAARNDGIRAAKGEYLAFMDPDDKYPSPDTLKDLYSAAVENRVIVAGGYLGYMDESGKPLPKDRSYFGVDFSCAGLLRYEDYQCDLEYTAFVFRRDFLVRNDLFFPTYVRFQDPPFFVRVMTAAGSFFAVDQMTYLYRVGLKKPSFSFRKASDVMSGIADNLKLSKEKGLARLHYLSAMRLLTDAVILVENAPERNRFSELVWQYIKTAGLIDEDLAKAGGPELPDPILPDLFVHLIDDSNKYHALRMYKPIRAFEKLYVRKKAPGSAPSAR